MTATRNGPELKMKLPVSVVINRRRAVWYLPASGTRPGAAGCCLRLREAVDTLLKPIDVVSGPVIERVNALIYSA